MCQHEEKEREKERQSGQYLSFIFYCHWLASSIHNSHLLKTLLSLSLSLSKQSKSALLLKEEEEEELKLNGKTKAELKCWQGFTVLKWTTAAV